MIRLCHQKGKEYQIFTFKWEVLCKIPECKFGLPLQDYVTPKSSLSRLRKGVWSERAGEAPMSPEPEAPLANAVPTSGTTQCLEIRADTPIGQRKGGAEALRQ